MLNSLRSLHLWAQEDLCFFESYYPVSNNSYRTDQPPVTDKCQYKYYFLFIYIFYLFALLSCAIFMTSFKINFLNVLWLIVSTNFPKISSLEYFISLGFMPWTLLSLLTKGQAEHTEMHNPLLGGLFLGDLSTVSMFASDSVLSDICKAFQQNRIFQESLPKMQWAMGEGIDKVKAGWTLLPYCSVV